MKRIVYALVLVMSIFALSGCGSTNERAVILKEYSFGHQYFALGPSFIRLDHMPFPLGQTAGDPWISQIYDKGTVSGVSMKNPQEPAAPGEEQTLAFQNVGRQVSLFVQAIEPGKDQKVKSLQTWADEAVANLRNTPGATDMVVTQEPVKLGTDMGRVIKATYVSDSMPIGLQLYLLYDRGILWRVTYLYARNDKLGPALMDYMAGQIRAVPVEVSNGK